MADYAGSNNDCQIRGYYPFASGGWNVARLTSNELVSNGATGNLGSSQNADGSQVLIWRLFLVFDTSAIPDDATVTQANLKLVCTNDDNTPTDFDVKIGKYDWSALEADLTNATKRETAYDGLLACTLDADWRSTSGMSVNTQYTSANLDTTWINKTGKTYYGLLSSHDRDNASPPLGEKRYIAIAMNNNATAGYRPVLTVTYTEAVTGALIKVNMNAQMQNLTGGMRS